jgi:ammonium transporter, Amt family
MHVDSGDTAWLLASAALVMFMTPGLAFFYGGLVRAKNVVGTIMQSFVALGLVSVIWVLVGYTLAFGPDHARLIGGLDFIGLRHVGATPSPFAPTVPATTFMVFQLMFAVITPALIAGAFAERMRFSGYLMFIGLWSLVVYSPVAHWVWGGGFLGGAGLKAIDFAGGSVVHANAGAAALATAIYLGRRRGTKGLVPHNVPFVVLGAGILWFGWFGFNAGSALGSGALASSAFVNTQLGAAAAMLVWLAVERRKLGKATTVGAATGAVAGLATITPAAGYVEPWAALVIGAAAGLICFLAVGVKGRYNYDDTLDVVGVHMVGGVLGVVLTGAFATLAINAAGAAASFAQVGRQALLALVTVVYSFVVTMLLLKVTDKTVGLTLTEEDEHAGLDLTQHGELGYRWSEPEAELLDPPPEPAAPLSG